MSDTNEPETILLPDYILAALGKVVAHQCNKLGRKDRATLEHYAAFADDVAQAIHRAMIEEQAKGVK